MDTIVEIKNWLIRMTDPEKTGFRDGVNATEFSKAYNEFLPVDYTLENMYSHFNGQTRGSTVNTFPGFRILSLDEIRKEINRWMELLEEEVAIGENQEDDYVCHPEKSIKPVFYDPQWLPFAVDGGGNFIALDYNPDTKGKDLQVIMCGTDVTKRYVLSDSLSDAFSSLYNHFISGAAVYSPEEGAILWGDEKLFHSDDILNRYGLNYFQNNSERTSE